MTAKKNEPLWFEGLRIAFYTCITAGHDSLKPVTNPTEGVDYIAFLSEENKEHLLNGESNGWETRSLSYLMPDGLDPIKQARYHKIRPHIVLSEYDLTIWIDGTMEVIGDLTKGIGALTNQEFDMMLVRHTTRQCIYDECEAIQKLRKDANHQRLQIQMTNYRSMMYPTREGLYDSSFLIRRNNDQVNQVMDAWWKEVAQYSHRDQLSLPVVLWNGGLPNLRIAYINTSERAYFVRQLKHTFKDKNLQKIHQLIPFDHTGRKNLGKAYNDEIKLMPDDSWIMVKDYDVMFVNPMYYENFQLAIKENPDAGLITCYASRTANPLQRLPGDTEYGSKDPSIINHKIISEQLDITYPPGTVTDLSEEAKESSISGFLMIFNKRVWKEVGGFLEKDGEALGIDNDFGWRVLKAGYKILRCDNNYAIHYYRLLEGQAFNDHLK